MLHPVKVVEGSPKLIELLLADAFRVTGQNLVLHLIDGSGDGGEQLLPTHTDVLQRQGGEKKIAVRVKKSGWMFRIDMAALPPYCNWCACCQR